jgi:feruloyl esterase
MECSTDAFQALGLFDEQFGKPLTDLVAKAVAAEAQLPAYCEVQGTMWPEIKFRVVLPATTWNERFYMAGGGGFDGTIPNLNTGLALNYASAGTDSGHDAAKEPLATFAYNPPTNTNPYAGQKKLDFAFRSYRETALIAKKIVKAFYGKDARFSYWVGCSEGGREALLMAQRFPDLFDGIVVGAPILNLTGAHMWSIWNSQALLGNGSIEINQLPLLAEKVYAKCDGIDGLVDGLIDDPRRCDFHPATDLPKCDAAASSCFTSGQIDALKKIYHGVKTSKGELLFPGLPPGAEVLAPQSGWDQWIIGTPSRQQLFGESSMQYLCLNPQPGPAWNWKEYNFDTDPPRMAAASQLFDMVNPDLRPFKARGGKMIHYHGWADTALTPLMSINYYESVMKLMGEKETKEFYKLYMIPGMFHCGGGVGCFDRNGDIVKLVNAIAAWVEKGTAPEAIVGSHVVDNRVVRTRPLCPYPEVEKYSGTGDINKAENFTCAMPAK